MAATSAPAPVNPAGSQLLGWLIFADRPRADRAGRRRRSPFTSSTRTIFARRFSVAAQPAADRRRLRSAQRGQYAPGISADLERDCELAEFLPGIAVPRILVPGAVPAVTHLLVVQRHALAVVFLSMVVVPPLVMRRRTSELHGAAGWNTWPTRSSSALRRSAYGIVLAQHHGQLLIHGGVESVLVLGPPGEGKTFGIASRPCA